MQANFFGPLVMDRIIGVSLYMMYNQNSIIATVNSIAAISVVIIIIIIIIIISFIYMSGYLAYKVIGNTTKPNTEIWSMLLKDDKYSGVT